MDPNLLRAFVAVRRHMSYTRAAEELVLSQPAVSRQIDRLEQELGVPLFERIGTVLHLTDAGRTLGAQAEHLLASLDRAAESVRAHGSVGHGRIRVGASTTPGYYLLPEPLGAFHAGHPGVEIAFSVAGSLEIEHRILRNDVDVAFVGAPPTSDELRVEPLVEDEIVCFASARHPTAKRRRLDAADLERELWIVREQGSATRRLVEAWLTQRGARMGATIEMNSPEAVKALVAAGLGIAFMSKHGLSGAHDRGRFRVLNVADFHLMRQIHVVRHREKHDTPAMIEFVDVVKRSVAQRRGSGKSARPRR